MAVIYQLYKSYFSGKENMRRCKCCIMPEVKDQVEFDSRGRCKVCAKQGSAGHKTEQVPAETGLAALQQKVNDLKADRQGSYDCVVGVSGGKDSTMTLYVAKKKLGLNPLAVFVDNGFCSEEMYQNVINATDALGVDLMMFKPGLIKSLFKTLLIRKKNVYFCRICNALIDVYLRETAARHGVRLLLGGYTKGQEFLKGRELFWIYRVSDDALVGAIKNNPEFRFVHDMFESLTQYFYDNFNSIQLVSPFQYLDYDEDEIVRVISSELGFSLPRISWPEGSTNCLFNVVSQFLAVRSFGYSQHEVEISTLVRKGEMSRQRALEIVETPMSREHMDMALKKIGLTCDDIL